MANSTIAVAGMSCEHCVQTIKKSLRELAGVNEVDVDLEQKKVAVEFDENQTNVQAIAAKIKEAGFEPHQRDAGH